MTYNGPQASDGRSDIVLQVDLGYPVATLLLSTVLLAIAVDAVSGHLATNTSDIYLPAPAEYAMDASGTALPACMLVQAVSLSGIWPCGHAACVSHAASLQLMQAELSRSCALTCLRTRARHAGQQQLPSIKAICRALDLTS